MILNILLDIFADESQQMGTENRIFLDIFVARNYPKYSQFIILPGTTLLRVLEELCYCKDEALKEECELAIHSLLSKYKPPDLDNLVSILYEVKYYSILQYVFRGEKRYAKLLAVSFDLYNSCQTLEEGSKLFDVLIESLNNTRSIDRSKERVAIDNLIVEHFTNLAELDCERFVSTVSRYSPHLHDHIFKLEDRKDLQYQYLRVLFDLVRANGTQRLPSLRARHLYISLLAERMAGDAIRSLLNTILTGPNDVDLPSVVDALIGARCIDSLIVLLSRQGRVSEAMIYLLDHMLSLDEEYSNASDSLEELEDSMKRYTSIGVDLCHAVEKAGTKIEVSGEFHHSAEQIWIRLIDTLVDISKPSDSGKDDRIERRKLFKRQLLRMTLSALLDSSGHSVSSIQHDATIVRIFRSILTPESSKMRTIGSVRPLLNDLFSAYRYQHTMLSVTEQLLDTDSYMSLLELVSERLKGWKVSRTGECEGCGRKVVGVGVDAEWLYKEWEEGRKRELGKTLTPKPAEKTKGKGRMSVANGNGVARTEEDGALVVFKCGHTYHLGCLRRLGSMDKLECIICD